MVSSTLLSAIGEHTWQVTNMGQISLEVSLLDISEPISFFELGGHITPLHHSPGHLSQLLLSFKIWFLHICRGLSSCCLSQLSYIPFPPSPWLLQPLCTFTTAAYWLSAIPYPSWIQDISSKALLPCQSNSYEQQTTVVLILGMQLNKFG